MRQRGLTLIEVVVVVSLFFVVGALVSQLFTFGAQMTTRGEERNSLQKNRIEASNRLHKSLTNSYRSGNTAFYVVPTGPRNDLVLSLIKPDSWDEEQQRVSFSSYDVYYRMDTDNTLRFLEVPITTTDVAAPLSETEVRDAITSDPGVIVMKQLESFQLIRPADGQLLESLSNPVGLRLVQSTARGAPLVSEMTVKLVTP